MTATPRENPYAGQGAVLLDIGGDVGALVVTMPAGMQGVEVEIRPRHDDGAGDDQHDSGWHRHQHEPDAGGGHHLHVAVVDPPVLGGHVPSLVFPELVEGRYDLYVKGTRDVRVTVDIRGGEVATAVWPT